MTEPFPIESHKALAVVPLLGLGYSVKIQTTEAGEPTRFQVVGLEPWQPAILAHFVSTQPSSSTVEEMALRFWQAVELIEPGFRERLATRKAAAEAAAKAQAKTWKQGAKSA